MNAKEMEEYRAERRKKIIIAARKCFEEKGLHGTSMMDIARATSLGAGQIYRCFSSKEEIVKEIVQEIVFQRVKNMILENHNLPLKAYKLASDETTINVSDQDDALLMEIHAESSRNKALLDILLEADDEMKKQGVMMMKNHFPGLSEEKLLALCEIIAVLTEGAIYRKRLRSSLINQKVLEELYCKIFNNIFNED